jgi:hypothetical protein
MKWDIFILKNLLHLMILFNKSFVLDLDQPVKGKTYSLFGNGVSTNFFYEKVESLTIQIMREHHFTREGLLKYIQTVNRNRRVLNRHISRSRPGEMLSHILDMLHSTLYEYITGIEAHLRSTPFYKSCTDKELFTTREQYYLHMIEFGLVNRVHREAFLGAGYRIALLPYCLRGTQDNCKAEPDHVDYRCKGCLKDCHVNQVSSLLRKYRVEPYIWRTSGLKPLLKGLAKEHGTVGVAGIACLVELVAGMRGCMEAHLPVIGIPLNANRCPRWMDTFHDTSVDLHALETLLATDHDLP